MGRQPNSKRSRSILLGDWSGRHDGDLVGDTAIFLHIIVFTRLCPVLVLGLLFWYLYNPKIIYELT